MVNAIIFARVYYSSLFSGKIFSDLDETLSAYSPRQKNLTGPISVTLTLPFKVKVTPKWQFWEGYFENYYI